MVCLGNVRQCWAKALPALVLMADTRWPVWMVVDLVNDLGGNTAKAAKRLEKPEAIVKMALAYAEAYPEEIAASLALHAHRDFEGLKAVSPNVERL